MYEVSEWGRTVHMFDEGDYDTIYGVLMVLDSTPDEHEVMYGLLDELRDSFALEDMWLPHQRIVAMCLKTPRDTDKIIEMVRKMSTVVRHPAYGDIGFKDILE